MLILDAVPVLGSVLAHKPQLCLLRSFLYIRHAPTTSLLSSYACHVRVLRVCSFRRARLTKPGPAAIHPGRSIATLFRVAHVWLLLCRDHTIPQSSSEERRISASRPQQRNATAMQPLARKDMSLCAIGGERRAGSIPDGHWVGEPLSIGLLEMRLRPPSRSSIGCAKANLLSPCKVCSIPCKAAWADLRQ